MGRCGRSRLRGLIVVLALLAVSCAPGGGGPSGGTIVWAFEQEPAVLNSLVNEGGMYSTGQIVLSTLLPLWVITPEYTYEPSPLLESAEMDEGPPFSVTYTLAEDADWSDGTPVSADDVLFTIETMLNDEWDIISRAGYDQIDLDATEILDEKTIRVVFQDAYAPWRTLSSTASDVILPKHALEGENFNEVWANGIVDPDTGEPIASGPFMFDSWDPGRQIEVVRNEAFAGTTPELDRVVFRFMPDSDTQLQQMRGGEIHVMDPQPHLDLVESLRDIDDVEVEIAAGPVWEHVFFQFSAEPLDRLFVRQAIAKAIDREAVVREFIGPMLPDAQPLDSLVFVSNHPAYEDHLSDVVAYDPDGAIELLEENGCERGSDEIFVCDDHRLSFEWSTTAGNQRRELFFEVAQQALAEIGIEITPSFGEPAVVFPRAFSGEGELFNFAWAGEPDPADNVELWKCEGSQNYHQHCPPDEVNDLLEATHFELDPDERMRQMNAAGRRLAPELPTLPLYQLPHLLAWNDAYTGLTVNSTQWGQVWNIAEWRLAD